MTEDPPRDHVRLAAGGPELVGPALHGRRGVGPHLDLVHRRAEEPVELQVAAVVVGLGPVGEPVLDNQFAVETPAGRRGRRLAAVVGLGRAGGEHDVGTARLGVGDEVLELADLVAAHGQPGLVVAFHPQAGASERGRQPGQGLERGRQVGQRDVGDTGHLSSRRGRWGWSSSRGAAPGPSTDWPGPPLHRGRCPVRVPSRG